jgi:hypothetical protein
MRSQQGPGPAGRFHSVRFVKEKKTARVGSGLIPICHHDHPSTLRPRVIFSSPDSFAFFPFGETRGTDVPLRIALS